MSNRWDWCEVHESRRSQPSSAFCLFAIIYPPASSFCRFVLVEIQPVAALAGETGDADG